MATKTKQREILDQLRERIPGVEISAGYRVGLLFVAVSVAVIWALTAHGEDIIEA